MPIEIRKLHRDDRAAIEATLRSDETFRADEVAVALELVDDALANEDSDYWFCIAINSDTGDLAGYICFGPTPMTQSTYDLYWIVSHSAHRGRGVAGSLIGAMEAKIAARGATAVRVETSQTDGYGAARRLYAKYGYPEAARFPDFYKPGDDLVVYYKKL